VVSKQPVPVLRHPAVDSKQLVVKQPAAVAATKRLVVQLVAADSKPQVAAAFRRQEAVACRDRHQAVQAGQAAMQQAAEAGQVLARRPLLRLVPVRLAAQANKEAPMLLLVVPEAPLEVPGVERWLVLLVAKMLAAVAPAAMLVVLVLGAAALQAASAPLQDLLSVNFRHPEQEHLYLGWMVLALHYPWPMMTR
jgi:hypothetical protein